jgi:6-phosphogluconolactonase
VIATTVVYVGCAGSREIHCFALDADSGALLPIDVVTVSGNEPSPSNMPMAFGPGQTMLYAALRTPPFPVSAFAVDRATGKLSCRSTAPLPAPMAYISVGANGRALMGASYKDARLSISEITLGDVQAHATQVLATPPKAHCIIPGRAAGVVYATTVDGNAIMVFRQNGQDGHLTPAEPAMVPLRPGSGPRHLALHPTANMLYCVNELGGTLTAFAIDGSGALRELQHEALTPPNFKGSARAADLHVTPDGRFAYASVRNTDAIAAFRLDDKGMMTAVGRFEVEASPRAFGLDPHGRFLICAGQRDNVVGVYAINPDSGALLRGHRTAVPENPSWILTLTVGMS